MLPLRELRNAILCRDRSAALITVASEVLERYRNEKQRRGLVDYDDLIDKALDLLRNTDAAWVHFKLDLGIDHLLIDEAQDTSTKQWEIVQRLVAEFTAGAGARPGTRTIFAVGDEKQSIFSFQNAAPREFAEMRKYFQKRHEDSGLTFEYRQLEHSFRSCESVLAAVDIVFKDIAGSVTSDSQGGIPAHIACRMRRPARWKSGTPSSRRNAKPIEGWDAPFDTVSEVSPRVKLARRIARTVRRLIDAREPVGLERRPARYGDVLVLVRQRGSLFEAIIRALKNEGVEVAGADRLVLTEHIAVMDLMALADALLLPHDDLALAAVLRSPLFGFSDQELFDIAADRGRKTLRSALADHSGDKFIAASGRLETLAHMARRVTPFAFFAHVLGGGGGRRLFLARLGLEANDALDEFLNLALDYERHEAPSLQGFLAWLREARAEIKRDMEIKRDEVRVMTVHGAKGLEAPIVILADTITPPAGPRPPRLLKLADGPLIWVGRKADDVAPVATARQLALRDAEDEYRRLLYVAMTRAADRLIVCGAEGVRGRPQGCWYDLVRGPLAELLVEEQDDGETVWRYRKSASAEATPASSEKPEIKARAAGAAALAARACARTTAAAGAAVAIVGVRRGDRPQRPGRSFGARPAKGAGARPAGAPADAIAARYSGRAAQRPLPSIISAMRRHTSTPRSVRRSCSGRSPFFRIRRSPKSLPPAAAPKCQSSAALLRRMAHRRSMSPARSTAWRSRSDTVLIADYKTDRAVPGGLGEVKPYVTQLALYRAVLARLYPGKTVRAALLFTEGPLLMEVPAMAMDEAFTALLAKSHGPVKVP